MGWWSSGPHLVQRIRSLSRPSAPRTSARRDHTGCSRRALAQSARLKSPSWQPCPEEPLNLDISQEGVPVSSFWLSSPVSSAFSQPARPRPDVCMTPLSLCDLRFWSQQRRACTRHKASAPRHSRALGPWFRRTGLLRANSRRDLPKPRRRLSLVWPYRFHFQSWYHPFLTASNLQTS